MLSWTVMADELFFYNIWAPLIIMKEVGILSV